MTRSESHQLSPGRHKYNYNDNVSNSTTENALKYVGSLPTYLEFLKFGLTKNNIKCITTAGIMFKKIQSK